MYNVYREEYNGLMQAHISISSQPYRDCRANPVVSVPDQIDLRYLNFVAKKIVFLMILDPTATEKQRVTLEG